MVSISGCAAAGPTAIAFRYIQRLALMSDPKWKDGHYYDSGLPAHGMQLARYEIPQYNDNNDDNYTFIAKQRHNVSN